MEFKHMEIKDFNNKYGVDLKEQWTDNGEFYDSLLKTIDNENHVSYFSASFCATDVIEDIFDYENEFNFELIEIENVYIAIY